MALEQPTLRTRDLITNAMENASLPAMQKFSLVKDSMKNTIQKRKRKAIYNFPEPKRLADINNEDLLQYAASNGELLLYADIGAADKNRILVFATETALECYKEATIFASDGTFDVIIEIIYF